jgi:hypothetical protein
MDYLPQYDAALTAAQSICQVHNVYPHDVLPLNSWVQIPGFCRNLARRLANNLNQRSQASCATRSVRKYLRPRTTISANLVAASRMSAIRSSSERLIERVPPPVFGCHRALGHLSKQHPPECVETAQALLAGEIHQPEKRQAQNRPISRCHSLGHRRPWQQSRRLLLLLLSLCGAYCYCCRFVARIAIAVALWRAPIRRISSDCARSCSNRVMVKRYLTLDCCGGFGHLVWVALAPEWRLRSLADL